VDAAQPGGVSIEGGERLRAAGLRATRPRLAVLSILEEAGGHRSADELVALLGARDRPLPRSTVYKVLGDLAGAGLVLTADVGPGRELFEAAAIWHHHFVCTACGAIVDVPCTRSRRPCLHPDLAGVEVDRAEVTFHGRCADCASSAR
jgi:Fur family ferric uptake transcriptional regulator